MVISQPSGNNPSCVIIVLHQHTLNCSECFQRHLMFYTCNYNIRVTRLNGAIKHIFYTESDPRRCQQIVLYSFCRSLRTLHLAVKILLQIFLYEDLSTLTLHTSVSCVPSRMPAGPHFVTQPILLSENIPNIWHQIVTKHKEVRPDWNDKNDSTKTTRLIITWKSFTNGSGCHF